MDIVKVIKESSSTAGSGDQYRSNDIKPSKGKGNIEQTKSKPPDGSFNHRVSSDKQIVTSEVNGLTNDEKEANLRSEHSMNGIVNGVSETDLKSHPPVLEDKKLITEVSSLCLGLSLSSVQLVCGEEKGQQSTPPSDSAINNLNKEKVEVSSVKEEEEIIYLSYESELQMPEIMRLIQKDLSEPYSIYTYRYFIHNWPKLCFLAMIGSECVGAIVCKLDLHRKAAKRGYIAMLAVDEKYRKRGIGSNLVLKAIAAMVADDADEVVLETEITNQPALRLYENLGFVRDKRLFRYYLNGVDALRLKLWLR